MTGIDFSQTSNSISNRMVYDEATGVRYVRPDNINGNWNARGMFMFNSAIGSKKLFNVSTFTNVSYDNAVGYVVDHAVLHHGRQHLRHAKHLRFARYA